MITVEQLPCLRDHRLDVDRLLFGFGGDIDASSSQKTEIRICNDTQENHSVSRESTVCSGTRGSREGLAAVAVSNIEATKEEDSGCDDLLSQAEALREAGHHCGCLAR